MNNSNKLAQIKKKLTV